jgi:Domain of unknown function (DUF1816)
MGISIKKVERTPSDSQNPPLPGTLTETMKELFTKSLNFLGLAWWVEITTSTPQCIYYFGPFETAALASEHRSGYVEDLQAEGAQNIVVEIKRCKPDPLTISPEDVETQTQVAGARN